MATTELVFKIRTDSADFKSTMAQVRSELTQTGKTQSTVTKGELTMRQQLAAASSLQRQRSAALIGEWKKTETAAKQLASGVRPVSTNLQRITDAMQALGGSSAALQGPLGGVAGRLRSLGALAGEAGGSLGVVGVAAGALVVATAAAAVGIFKLVSASAEATGKFHDLAQQTGFAVETLSALGNAAETSGGDIGSITNALFLFETKMGDAKDATSEAGKIFKALEIDTTNNERALRQAITALLAMTNAEDRATIGKKLFGRSVKDLLGAIKEAGSLDAFLNQQLKEGTLITTEAARKGDQLSDSIVRLNQKFSAITRHVASEFAPLVSDALSQFSKWLRDNQKELVDTARDVARLLRDIKDLASFIYSISPIRLHVEIIRTIKNFLPAADTGGPPAGKSLFDKAREFLDRGPTPTGSGGALVPVDVSKVANQTKAQIAATAKINTDAINAAAAAQKKLQDALASLNKAKGGGGGKGRTERDTSLADATRDAALANREALQIIAADVTENRRALEEQTRSIEEFTKRAIDLNGQQLDATIDRITAESDALDAALAKKLITQDDYEAKQRDLDLDAAKAHQDNKDEAFKLEQDRDRKISEARIAAKQRELQILEELDQQDIKRIDQRIEDNLLSVSKGERQIAAIVDAGFVRRRKALEEESDAYSTTAERRADITAEIIRQDNARAFSAEDAARRIAKAAFDEQNAAAQGATRNRRFAIDRPEITGSVDQLFEAIRTQLTGDTQAAALAGLEAMSLGFEQLGQAVGQALHAFVLFGSAGTSVRKVTAEVLAGIAQMAATKAIYHLAEGFAALAMAFFGVPNAGPSAVAHFKAAAIYGLVAGVAAVAGRGVAGNAFNGASGGGGGGGNGPGQLNPLTLPRNQPQPIRIVIGVDDSTFGRAITAHVVKDVQEAGQIREVIANDGAFT